MPETASADTVIPTPRPRLLLCVGLLSWLLAMGAQADQRSLELTGQTRQHLTELKAAWQSWEEAFQVGEAEAASKSLDQIQTQSRALGLRHLPDLSIAASAHAVLAAGQGQPKRARIALTAARKLDGARPEIDFAEATIHRLNGDYLGAISSGLKGYAKLFRLPVERSIWLQNIAIWVIYVLLLSGAAFLALQMGVKGKDLFYDISRMMSPPLPRIVADLLTIVLLIWPILLPSGILWLALYWSVLVWGYGSLSEKLVFVFLWAFVGLTPILLSYQQLAAQLRMIPTTRAMDNLQSDRLYGTLFNDIGLLPVLLPDSLASREIVADLHRRLGQWDQARTLYSYLADNPDLKARDTAAPLSNIGLYYLRNRDYDNAKDYFQRATTANPNSAEAFYNLSQAYSLLFDFDNSERNISRAQSVDREKVEKWTSLKVPPERSGVPIEGGLARYPTVSQELKQLWGGGSSFSIVDLWRRNFSLAILLATLLLAVTLHMVRLQLGYRSSLLEEREPSPPAWLRALVPGLSSIHNGNGWGAFFGIICPTGLLILPWLRGIGYRTPFGLDPGQWLPMVASVVALLLVMLIRLGWEMASES